MTRPLVIGALLSCLTLCAACAGKAPTVTVPQVIRVSPAPHLMDPTPVPPCDPVTNADLLGCYLDTRAALERANADKAAIRRSVREGTTE